MSNLGCECGNVIHDSGEPIPNKAHLLPDQALDALWEALAAELGSFAESLRDGTHALDAGDVVRADGGPLEWLMCRVAG